MPSSAASAADTQFSGPTSVLTVTSADKEWLSSLRATRQEVRDEKNETEPPNLDSTPAWMSRRRISTPAWQWKLRWHDLRHVAASLLIAEGASVGYVSRLLGHANPSITLGVYAHAFAAVEHDAATRERMEIAFGEVLSR